MTHPFAVMCCGCGRLLEADGSMGPQLIFDGLLRFDAIEDFSGVPSFRTKQDADEFAESHGWTTSDRDGPNHRCPNCQKAQDAKSPYAGMVERRGAYVTFAAGRPVSIDAQMSGGVATS